MADAFSLMVVRFEIRIPLNVIQAYCPSSDSCTFSISSWDDTVPAVALLPRTVILTVEVELLSDVSGPKSLKYSTSPWLLILAQNMVGKGEPKASQVNTAVPEGDTTTSNGGTVTLLGTGHGRQDCM